MKKKCMDLPQDLWARIFDKLDKGNLEELSLVSKQFLSITNRLKTSLKIMKETLPSLEEILQRFQYLESITICVRYDNSYADILHKISSSGLDCKGRTNLKRLHLDGWYKLDSESSIAIANLFPWLEEISFPQSVSLKPRQFEELQRKLTALKKVSFECVNDFPSHESLISLSLNCVNLEEIDIDSCIYNNPEAFGFIMRHSPKLTVLKLPSLQNEDPVASLSIQDSIAYAKNLHSISFSGQYISEDVVCSFIEANPPLQKFEIEFWGHLPDGEIKTTILLPLFRACSSIQHLSITGNDWLSDNHVKTISENLTRLTHVDFSQCKQLTTESFSILTKKCCFLEEIRMTDMRIGGREAISADFHKHEKLRYLDLSYNKSLDDRTLIKFLFAYPNLMSIDINNCSRLTTKGVRKTLKSCVLLTDLRTTHLYNVSNIFGKYFDGRTVCLKLLDLSLTAVNDKVLHEIGKVCTHLELLYIIQCERVTNVGVMEVVIKCKNLKKIYVEGCQKLDTNKLLDNIRSKPWIKQNILRFGYC